MEWTLDLLRLHGIKRIVFNLHHLAEETRAFIINEVQLSGIDVKWSDESETLLGSGGGIRTAMRYLEGDRFFVINGDVLNTTDLKALDEQHSKNRNRYEADFTWSVFKGAGRGGSYTEILLNRASDQIVGLGNKSSQSPFFTGTSIFERSALAHLPVNHPFELVPEVVRPAISKGKACAFVSDGFWADMGDIELWWRTHFELADWIRGHPESCPKAWTARLRGCGAIQVPGSVGENWVFTDEARSPLGPGLVAYGPVSDATPRSNGIVFSDLSWSRS